tara:strand:- start:742 stop:855 length:114 start_codon:yes stop_codon:yes gene_type:complete
VVQFTDKSRKLEEQVLRVLDEKIDDKIELIKFLKSRK